MNLGVVEGFYGPLWSWGERRTLMEQLAPAGYQFWHYAPKADTGVRENWRQPWDNGHARALAGFADECRRHGMRFGIGLTPVGLGDHSPETDWTALDRRLAQLDEIGVDELLLGFDDLPGDKPALAAQQARIVDWAGARSGAERLMVCPTYFSDDPLLDRLFGTRPEGYLEQLGAALDPAVGIYWAGEAICSREISTGHVERVAAQLGRPPLLWDNYPVNDSALMRRHLHLQAFTGRAAALAEVTAGHAVNPALQPRLTAIPALTLPERYRLGERYCYMEAFRKAAVRAVGPALAADLEADLALLAETGLDRLGEKAARLRRRYAAHDHPAAAEVVRWLDGGYADAEAAPG